MRPLSQNSSHTTKLPRAILSDKGSIDRSQFSDLLGNTIFAFPPNRDTLGGTAYFIVRNESNILIDSPALEKTNQDFLNAQGGVQRLFITHRGAIGKTEEIQKIFNCEVLIQEQEAYLLPGLSVTTFGEKFSLDSEIKLIWTPGHSPGSSCLYYSNFGGVLFSGRHIIPDLQGEAALFRTAKTFHWRRQKKSLELLLEFFTAETLQHICPGANIGFLRGKYLISQAYEGLRRIQETGDRSQNAILPG